MNCIKTLLGLIILAAIFAPAWCGGILAVAIGVGIVLAQVRKGSA